MHRQPPRSDTAPAIQRAADTVIVAPPAPPQQQVADTVIIAPSAPPPRTEVIPPAPSTEAVWQPGHWAWDGTQYIWVAGQYIARPQVAWVPGHWDQGAGGWVWVDGHWQ